MKYGGGGVRRINELGISVSEENLINYVALTFYSYSSALNNISSISDS